MVFVVEPLYWVEGIRGVGGVRPIEMVPITENGPHVDVAGTHSGKSPCFDAILKVTTIP